MDAVHHDHDQLCAAEPADQRPEPAVRRIVHVSQHRIADFDHRGHARAWNRYRNGDFDTASVVNTPEFGGIVT